MSVLVHFEYDGGELELKSDEPSITVEDVFGSFLAVGICVKCKAEVSIVEFECA